MKKQLLTTVLALSMAMGSLVIPAMAEEAELETVQSILSHLTKTQAEIVQAVCFEGMSITEFAKRKGISQPAASQRLMTAKKRLKKYL